MNTDAFQLGMREKGTTVSISIGTALAVEGALGVYPDRPESPMPLRRYKDVWFNVHTLFRNLYGSVSTESHKNLLPHELLSALKEDMLGAASALVAYQLPKGNQAGIRVVFYVNDYSKIGKKFPAALLKRPTTQLQELYYDLEKATLELLVKYPADVEMYAGGLTIQGNHGAALMVTHYAVDLLSRYSFSRLDLLESHSGKIKPPPLWNTKLGVTEGVEFLPFNGFTLQVFGDRSTQFMAHPVVLRRAILKLAQTHRWSPVTTMDKIKADIKSTKDPFLMTATSRFM